MKSGLLFFIGIILIFVGAVFFIQPAVNPPVVETSIIHQVVPEQQSYEYQTATQDPGPSPDQGLPTLSLPIVLHPVRNSGVVSTIRTNENILALFETSQLIWDQADIKFTVILQEIVLNKALQKNITEKFFGALNNTIDPTDNRIHIFFVNSLQGTNGIAYYPQLALVADVTTVNSFRATAHEIGHLLGIEHTFDSRARLMYRGVNGTNMIEEEIDVVRKRAQQLYN